MAKGKTKHREEVLTKDRHETREPSMYKVLLHNDDYTSMEFVVMILEKIFHKSTAEATRIMLNVHNRGTGVAGVYTRELGETKIVVVHDIARQNDFPLKCSLEKVQ